MTNQRSWIEIAEYISLAGSIVGSVVAVVSKQLIYAATPVSLSLLLNLVNRQRWEYLNRQNTARNLTQVERLFSNNVEYIRQQILALPTQADLGGMQAAIGRVAAGIAQIQGEMAEQTQDLGSFQTNIQNLANQRPPDLTGVQAQIERLSQRLDLRTLSESGSFDLRPLQAQIEELKQALGQLSERIAQVQQSIQNLAPRQEISTLASEIDKIHSSQRVLEQAIAPFASEFAKLFERMADIRFELNTRSEEFNSQPVEVLQATSAEGMQELREALAGIHQRLDELPVSLEPRELGSIEAALEKLAREIVGVQVQMQNSLARRETFDLNSLREDMGKMLLQCANLLESLERLGSRAIADIPIAAQSIAETSTDTIIQQDIEEQPSTVPLTAASVAARSTWRCVNTLRGHSNAITCLCLSPNGKILASGSYQEIKLWNLDRGEEMQSLTVRSEAMAVSAIAISPNGEILACANGNVEIWHLGNGQIIRTLETSCWASSVAISPDGNILVSAGEDPVDETGSIQIWNLQTGELLHEFEQASYSVAISPNGQFLASGGVQVDELDELDETGLIQLRRVETGELLYAIAEDSGKVYSVAISPDGQILASGSQNGTIKLWNLRTGELHSTLTGHTLSVHCVAIGPDGQLLASGSGDKTIKVWNLQTSQLLDTLSEHSEKVSAVAFSPQGQILVSGSHDETLKIWQCD